MTTLLRFCRYLEVAYRVEPCGCAWVHDGEQEQQVTFCPSHVDKPND